MCARTYFMRCRHVYHYIAGAAGDEGMAIHLGSDHGNEGTGIDEIDYEQEDERDNDIEDEVLPHTRDHDEL